MKLDIENIDEIFYCYNSSRLSDSENKILNEMYNQKNIKLKLHSINTIVHDVYFEYPIIARDYLGISVDTEQIMKSEDFVEWFDSLRNKFSN